MKRRQPHFIPAEITTVSRGLIFLVTQHYNEKVCAELKSADLRVPSIAVANRQATRNISAPCEAAPLLRDEGKSC